MPEEGIPTGSGWLLKAQNHLRSAEALSHAQPPLHENACFHLFHAVAAALKAFLSLYNITISAERDLTRIHDYAKHVDKSMSRYDMTVDLVKPYRDYADTIDPNRSISYPELQESLTNTKKVVRFVSELTENRS